MLSGKCTWRVWAAAEESQPRPDGAIAPSAPFAQDFIGVDEADNFKSSAQKSFAKGWSEEVGKCMESKEPAGVHHRPQISLADCVHKSSWDNPDWKALKSTYMHDSDAKVLSRHHRRFLKNINVDQQAREARWAKCFKQWERDNGKFNDGVLQDGQSRVSGTDFSIQPAGFVPKQLSPAELARQMAIQRGMADAGSPGGLNSPCQQAVDGTTNRLEETILPAKSRASSNPPALPISTRKFADERATAALAPASARQERYSQTTDDTLLVSARPSSRQKQPPLRALRKHHNSKYAKEAPPDGAWNGAGRCPTPAFGSDDPEAASVERRLRTMHGWGFASKIARAKKKQAREASTSWAPVAAVPYHGVPTSRK